MGRNGRHKEASAPLTFAAFVTERFTPGAVNIVTIPADESPTGQAKIEWQQFVGKVRQVGQIQEFMMCRIAELAPQTALALGEYLIVQAQGVSGKVHLPGIGEVPGDLRGQG